MKKVVAALGITAGLGVVGLVGASAWTGRTVSARLTQQTQEISKVFPAFKVVEDKVDRGLFGSTRNVTVQLGCLPAGIPGVSPAGSGTAPEPIQVSWRDEIGHRPWSGSLATIDSQLILPDKWQGQVKKLVGEKPLLSVKSVVAFSGDYTSDIATPELKISDPNQGSLVLGAIKARLKGKANADPNVATRYSLDIPSVTMQTETQGEHFSVRATGLETSVQMSPSADPALWLRPSQSKGSVASLELGGAVPAAGAAGAPVKAVFENLVFTAQTILEGGLWTGTNALSMKGRLNDFAVDKVELKSALRRVHAATYQAVMTRLLATMLSCDQKAQESALETLLNDVQQQLPELLLHDPEYALDSFAFELGGQRGEVAYSVGTKGISKEELSAPLAIVLAQKAVARARAQIQLGLIERLVKAVADTMGAAAPAAQGATGASEPLDMMPMVAQMIGSMVELGYLAREGDVIKSSAAYEGGQLSVNGKPLDLSSLMGLSGP